MKHPYIFTLSAIAAIFVSTSVFTLSHADETASEKIENKAGDIKTDAKKGYRRMKRHARKANGTDNVGKDAKDKMNDAGDDISNGANKVKKKVD